jgi:hypothetical protein
MSLCVKSPYIYSSESCYIYDGENGIIAHTAVTHTQQHGNKSARATAELDVNKIKRARNSIYTLK